MSDPLSTHTHARPWARPSLQPFSLCTCRQLLRDRLRDRLSDRRLRDRCAVRSVGWRGARKSAGADIDLNHTPLQWPFQTLSHPSVGVRLETSRVSKCAVAA